MVLSASTPCPCGSTHSYKTCCQPLHLGAAATTAEALMRSRYCAYVLELTDYLRATWHPTTRPAQLDLAQDPKPKWLGLEIKRHQVLADDAALVEFVARYKVGGRAHRLHEISRFERLDEHWFYVDGEFPQP